MWMYVCLLIPPQKKKKKKEKEKGMYFIYDRDATMLCLILD